MKYAKCYNLAIILSLSFIFLSSCANNAGKNDLRTVKINHSTPGATAASGNGNGAEIAVSGTDYEMLVPKIDFGERLFTVKQDNGRTFLYSDVTFSDIESYVLKLEAMGYTITNYEISEKKDMYIAEFSNSQDGTSVKLNYSKTGLSLNVFFE